jgi:Cu+-exporting ATPase
MERLAALDTLAIDKTGTLTEGRPALARVLPVEGVSETELLRLAAALEQSSEHPLAQAVVAAAKERGLALETAADFGSTTAAGVTGTIGATRVLAGNAGFLRAQQVAGVDALEALAAPHQAGGATAVFVAAGGRALGVLTIEDPIRTTTPEALADLRALGIRVLMLTGDHASTAAHVAQQLGLAPVDVRAGVTPEGKHAAIAELRAAGRVVGMAGDGINDAPALAAADIGIAMGTGTDIAMESAGVTLVKGDLRGIVRSVRLARAMLGNIRQNLFFAFIYNALGIPVAAGLLYPWWGVLMNPMIAGAAMSLSSVSVIANALRLRHQSL